MLRAGAVRQRVHNELGMGEAWETDTIETALTESEVIREIAYQVNQLPEQCRAVVRLILFEGMTTEEVARQLAISARNVLNQKQIAVRKIRAALLKKGLADVWAVLAHFFS